MVRSSPCSNLKEELKTEILFVDFVCCEGAKFGKIGGKVKSNKMVHFDYFNVFFKLYVVYLKESKCKRHRWVNDTDPPSEQRTQILSKVSENSPNCVKRWLEACTVKHDAGQHTRFRVEW